MKKNLLTILMFLFLLPNLYAKNLIKNLEATGKHNTFISILENNPLFLSIINNSVKSTIFAPTDEAFKKMPNSFKTDFRMVFSPLCFFVFFLFELNRSDA